MAYVFKRSGSKNWYIGWYDPQTGEKGTPVSTRTANKKQAEEKAREFQKELDARNSESGYKSVADTSLSMSEAFNLFVQDRKNTGRPFSPLTLESYNTALNNFYRTVGDKKIFLYTRADYHTFVDGLQFVSRKDKETLIEHSQNSKSVYSKRIHAIFTWLVKEKYLTENPMKRVKEELREFKLPSQEEINTILEYASRTKYSDIIHFYILSGFRKMEAINLKWSGIEAETITTLAKGGRYRTIPILDEMRDWLCGYIKRNPVPEDKNTPVFDISPDMIHRFWLRCRKQTGLRGDISTHDLRKYCGSEMANSGVPLNFTKEYLGHDRVETTMVYYIRNDKTRMVPEINAKVRFIKKDYGNSPDKEDKLK